MKNLWHFNFAGNFESLGRNRILTVYLISNANNVREKLFLEWCLLLFCNVFYIKSESFGKKSKLFYELTSRVCKLAYISVVLDGKEAGIWISLRSLQSTIVSVQKQGKGQNPSSSLFCKLLSLETLTFQTLNNLQVGFAFFHGTILCGTVFFMTRFWFCSAGTICRI